MITIFGYLCMEMHSNIEHNLTFPCSITASNSHIDIGGSSLNQAISAARSGAKISVIGTIGNDLFGNNILHILRHEGIQSSGIIKNDDNPTGIINSIINQNNQKAEILLKGANEYITSNMISNNSLNERILLMLQDETPDHINLEILKRAQKQKSYSIITCKKSMNTDLYNYVDIFIQYDDEGNININDLNNFKISKPENIDRFVGTFAACKQARFKTDRAIEYGIAAASITSANNPPYLDEIKSNLKIQSS